MITPRAHTEHVEVVVVVGGQPKVDLVVSECARKTVIALRADTVQGQLTRALREQQRVHLCTHVCAAHVRAHAQP